MKLKLDHQIDVPNVIQNDMESMVYSVGSLTNVTNHARLVTYFINHDGEHRRGATRDAALDGIPDGMHI